MIMEFEGSLHIQTTQIFQLTSRPSVETKLSDTALCQKLIECNTHQQPNEFVFISNLKQYRTKISYHCETVDFISPHLPLWQKTKPQHQAKEGCLDRATVRGSSLIGQETDNNDSNIICTTSLICFLHQPLCCLFWLLNWLNHIDSLLRIGERIRELKGWEYPHIWLIQKSSKHFDTHSKIG